MSPRLGALILFEQGDLWVAHRIAWIRRNAQGTRLYLTRGDGNRHFDSPWVEEDRILGRVVGVVEQEQDHLFGLSRRWWGGVEVVRSWCILIRRKLRRPGTKKTPG